LRGEYFPNRGQSGWGHRLEEQVGRLVVGSRAVMERRTVKLNIAGQKYRVVSSVGEEELQRLAGIVSAKLDEVAPPGRTQPPQAILLAAMALAHEAEAERSRRESLERRTRELLRSVLDRIDAALGPPETEAAGGE
jgi:cell division protein ZapA